MFYILDYNRALSYFRAAAKEGSLRALRQLGLIYLNGLTAPTTSNPTHAYSIVRSNAMETDLEISKSASKRNETDVVFVVNPDFNSAVKIFKQGAIKRDLGCALYVPILSIDCN
jgi:TPR repeat protein